MEEKNTTQKKAGRPSKADILEKKLAEMEEKMNMLLEQKEKDEEDKANLKQELSNALNSKKENPKDSEKTKIRKRVPKDIDVTIRSNIDGDFLYAHPTNPEASFRFDSCGDEDSVSLGGLISINKDSRWLKSGKVAVVDVYSDEYTVEDVIKALKLEKLYYKEDKLSPAEIDILFTDEVDYEEFDKILLENREIVEAILEVALVMKKNGKLNDYAKVQKLKQRTRNPALFG